MCNSWNFQWRYMNESFRYIFKMWNYQSFMHCRLWPHTAELIESAVLALKVSPWKWQCVFYCLLVICNSKMPKFMHEKVFLPTASLHCKTLLNPRIRVDALFLAFTSLVLWFLQTKSCAWLFQDAALKLQIRPHKKFAWSGSEILCLEYPQQEKQTRQEQTAFSSAGKKQNDEGIPSLRRAEQSFIKGHRLQLIPSQTGTSLGFL